MLRNGPRLRLTDADGNPTVVIGADTAWDFTETPARPRATATTNLHWHGNGTEVTRRRWDGPVTSDAEVEFTVHVHTWAADGSFQASTSNPCGGRAGRGTGPSACTATAA